MRVAIIENTAITHHGQVGVALHEQAARIDLYKPWANGRLPEAGAHDALIVFGGEQSARSDDTHPYLPALADLMRESTALDRAVLGICLGAQLLARGFGAENRIGAAPEFGWCEVSPLPDAATDPVLSALPGPFRIFQWHSDTFTLPQGATRLAASAMAENQCFRIGRATYGMQFHFEASRPMVADWTRTFPVQTNRMAPGWTEGGHQEQAARFGAAADAAGLAIARAFVALI